MISLRAFHRDDEANLVALANNERVTRYLREQFPRPYSKFDARYWIDEGSLGPEGQHFAISLAGECIGSIGIFWGEREYRYSGEIGYWLGEPFWGKGYASAALLELTDWLLDETELQRFYALVVEQNIASMRVLEKCGYRCEGVQSQAVFRNDQFHDEHLYVRLRS